MKTMRADGWSGWVGSLAVLLAAGWLVGNARAEEKRTVQPEDIARLRSVGDPQISPDGEWVAYTVGTADLAKDKRATNLWVAKWDGNLNRALTNGDKKQTHPRWSPDGKTLAFLSSRADEHEDDQVWLLPMAGGEAQSVTEIKGGVEDFAWSPDGKRLVLVTMDPDPRDPEGHEKDKKTVPPIVIDRFQFKQDIEGYLTDRHRHLRLLDVASRKVENLTDGTHDDLLPAWSPDGQEIAFVTKRGEDPDRTENWDIYVVEAKAGGTERQLTTTPESDGVPDAESAPTWSPDGQWIAYLHGGDPKKIEYAPNSLAVIPAKGGEARVLKALDRNVIQPRWAADGQSVFVLEEDDGAQMLIRVPFHGSFQVINVPGSGRSQIGFACAHDIVLGGRRDVTVYGRAANGRVAALVSTPEHPAEVFAVETAGEAAGQSGGMPEAEAPGGTPSAAGETPTLPGKKTAQSVGSDDKVLRPLSRQNDEWLGQVKLAKTTETKFSSKDGTEIHGFLVHALDRPDGQRGPALLRPHGGPQSQYACAFNFEAQLFAANGYAVILPNPRGSTGRGEAFAMGIYAAWGSVDVQDDLAAVDDAVARGIADPDKLGVGGWSYGGISTNYLIASTTRFKAATSGAGSANMLATFGTDEYIRDLQSEFGPPWQSLQKWLDVSYPFLHADRIQTPTLFLCGENDFNVPLINSEQMYQALRVLGVPTELVIYPGQFHGFTVPSYQVDRLKRYLDWYAKWMGAGTKG